MWNKEDSISGSAALILILFFLNAQRESDNVIEVQCIASGVLLNKAWAVLLFMFIQLDFTEIRL